MEYDNYYEQDDGDEVVVHLDYLEPEPSLFQQSRGHDRPMIPREYAPVVRTSKQRLSRPNNTNGREFNRLPDNSEDYYDDRDDEGDDDMYGRMTSRVNIQDERISNRTVGSTRSRRLNPNLRSGSSVVSRQSKKKSKMDLTRPDADSSFELFATLLIQHLDPKIKEDMYVLEKGDMAYFDAIMPETLRVPFVEAVRVRSRRLTDVVVNGESDLDTITRKCAAFGLGQSFEHNFLLGGGEKRDGKIIIRVSNVKYPSNRFLLV